MRYDEAIRRYEKKPDMVRLYRDWHMAYKKSVEIGTRKADPYVRLLRYFSKLNSDERYWR